VKSIFLSLILSISLVTLLITLSACANNPRPSVITIEDSDSLATIKVSGAQLEKELNFNNGQYEISIQNVGDNLFHIDAKIISTRVDKVTGEKLVSSNQIVTQVKAEPEEKVTIGGLDSWSESIQADGSVKEIRSQKRYILEIVK